MVGLIRRTEDLKNEVKSFAGGDFFGGGISIHLDDLELFLLHPLTRFLKLEFSVSIRNKHVSINIQSWTLILHNPLLTKLGVHVRTHHITILLFVIYFSQPVYLKSILFYYRSGWWSK